jgi:phosphoribosylamine--glycine ligase
MKVLVIGSGGREHALVWKISKSPLVKKIYCAPGNPGIAELAQLIDISVEDIPSLIHFARDEEIDLTVVGPELPLTLGIVDEFKKQNLKIFGPSKQAAQLEGSKNFSKSLMQKYGIPTAEFQAFSNSGKAMNYLKNSKYPIVIKADGLAGGKGVLVAQTFDEAGQFISKVMEKKVFGNSGQTVVIEEYLEGKEISVLAFLDGKSLMPLPEARDHKRAMDHDQGSNTGGMGAYSPVPGISKMFMEEVVNRILKPTQAALLQEGVSYQGVLYAGLMVTSSGPKVLEFNVRFGDPETQVILPRIKTDLVPIFMACIDGTLLKNQIDFSQETALCVVLASGGYPESYQNGFVIQGLDRISKDDNVVVFHAGTRSIDKKILTSGGRVLSMTSLAQNIEEARELVYRTIHKVHFEKMHYRTDIGLCQS